MCYSRHPQTDSWGMEQMGAMEQTMLERVQTTYAPYLYALLRIIAGLLLACHGAQKLFGMFGGVGPICARIPEVPLDNRPSGCNGHTLLFARLTAIEDIKRLRRQPL